MSTLDFNRELPALGLVAAMGEDDRRLLGDYGEFILLEEGTDLFAEGDSPDGLHILISGQLHLHAVRDGERTLLGLLGPGQSLGEVSLFDPAPAAASATARERSRLWKASRSDLQHFMAAYPEAACALLAALLAGLSRRVRDLHGKLRHAGEEDEPGGCFP